MMRPFWKRNISEGPRSSERRLRCIIENTSILFWVTVSGEEDISQLKEHIHKKASQGTLKGVDSLDLEILKVRGFGTYR
jgi:hypothetical protein